MDRKAINKARQRFRVASESARELENVADYERFSDKWYVFLHAAKGVYTVLEQGAKSSAQARQWFGGKNQERKSDPLLRYISEARNDDEHGIEEITEKIEQSMLLGVNRPSASTVMQDQFGNTFVNCGAAWNISGASPASPNLPTLTSLDGKKVISEFRPERVTLKPVRDRSLTVYNPPKSHLGINISTDDPREVSRLGLKYLDFLILEAEGFCTP